MPTDASSDRPPPASSAQQRIAETQDYLKRGRFLTATPTRALETQWLALFAELARGDVRREIERCDIEAELALRGFDPPVERASADLRRLVARADALFAAAWTDPPRSAYPAALLAAFAAFRREFEAEIDALLVWPL